MEMVETLTVILNLIGSVLQITQVCAISSVVMEPLIQQNSEMIQVLLLEMDAIATDRLRLVGSEMELQVYEHLYDQTR